MHRRKEKSIRWLITMMIVTLLAFSSRLGWVRELSAEETILELRFDEESDVVHAAGEATIEHGDNFYRVTERTNNYDGIDLPFSDLGMTMNYRYQLSIAGHIEDVVDVQEQAEIWLQVPSGDYPWLAGAPMVSGEAFVLEGSFDWLDEIHQAFRIQSSEEGKTVPFCIDTVSLQCVEPLEEQAKKPDIEESLQNPSENVGEEILLIDFEDEEFHGFEGRAGVELLELNQNEDHSADGQRCLAVSGREESWHGASVRIESLLKEDANYEITAWVKAKTEQEATYTLSVQVGEGQDAAYLNLASVGITPEDGWQELKGQYFCQSTNSEYIAVYVEASAPSAEYYLDDIAIKHITEEKVEYTEMDPIKDQYQDDFLIGTAVSMLDLEGEALENTKHHYNVVTCDNAMKPSSLVNDEREFDFSAADRMIGIAEANGLQFHGHVLVWHQQSPDWLWEDEDGEPLSREDALENMSWYIETVMEHFADRVMSWDVVNEALDGDFSDPKNWQKALRDTGWLRAIGDDYIYEAFKKAREVVDKNGWDNMILFYNDYNDDQQDKAATIYYMIKAMNEEYKAETGSETPLISGVGMQGHYNHHTRAENVQRSIERFRDLGIDIVISELDATTLTSNEVVDEELDRQAIFYAEIFKIFKENSDVISRVTFWGTNDGTSWRGDRYPLPFDAHYNAKKAYYAIMNPENYLLENKVNEAPAEKRLAQISYGTPKISSNSDPAWNDAPVLPVNQYLGAWQGATAEAKLLWNEDNLLIQLMVADPVLDASAEMPHEQDSIEVFINESNVDESYYIDGVGQYRLSFEDQLTVNPESYADGVDHIAEITADGYRVEMAIPWKIIQASPGTIIGFDLQVNDAENGSRISVACWNDTSGQAYQDPTCFGELELIGKE